MQTHLFEPTTWAGFSLSLAQSEQDRNEIFDLRHQVFYRELQGLTTDGLDVDEFDHDCDHLLVRDSKTNDVIGTYRLRCSRFTDRFYSQTEFHIDELITDPRVKVEVGRACIHQGWRNNLALIALWRGLTGYMRAVEADLLFGCSSILSTDSHIAATLAHYFRSEDAQLPGYLRPRAECRLSDYHPNLVAEQTPQERKALVEHYLPPLLRCYLRAGAKVSQQPILDKAFGCLDFLTVLDLHDCDQGFVTRYGG